MRLALRSATPDASTVLYGAGLASLVTAGFLFAVIVGFLALGAALLAAGYMAEGTR